MLCFLASRSTPRPLREANNNNGELNLWRLGSLTCASVKFGGIIAALVGMYSSLFLQTSASVVRNFLMIEIITEDRFTAVTTVHNVIDRASIFDAQRTGHDTVLLPS